MHTIMRLSERTGNTAGSQLIKMFSLLTAVLIILNAVPAAVSAKDIYSYSVGLYRAFSSFTREDYLTDSFYYTDSWFNIDSYMRNDALALLSMQLCASAISDEEDGTGAELLKALGFGDIRFTGFRTYDDPDDCAYISAVKTMEDCTVVAVVIQSFSFDRQVKVKGWTQNFIINGDDADDGEHYALAKAADKVINGIVSLGGSGTATKYWITGQSRGGGLANLIAAKLSAKKGIPCSDIYAYTFEAPATVAEDEVPDNASRYGFIHNYLCSSDIVTLLPMWGMTRYGVDHKLDTDETEERLCEELTRLGSAAAETAEYISYCEELMHQLIDALESRVSAKPDCSGIPDRADYSKVRTDEFTDIGGTGRTVTYCYQDTFASLMKLIFSGELEGIDVTALLEDADTLYYLVNMLKTAVVYENDGMFNESKPYYWEAACGVRTALSSLLQDGSLSMSENDIYALLRLAGPVIVSTDYEIDESEKGSWLLYLLPLMDIVEAKDRMTFSHHFDTLIARLKTLAPQPDLENIDISIDAPAEGDSAGKAPKQVSDEIAKLGIDGLTVEDASWNSGEGPLKDGAVYYLTVTLKAIGRLIPDDLSFLINGKAPSKTPETSYESGSGSVTATWAFTVGTPETRTVSFSAGNGITAPEPITVKKGEMLRYTARPDITDRFTDSDTTWLFRDWKDGSGVFWDDICVTKDITLTAEWIKLIDDMQIIFRTPSVGGRFTEPFLLDGAPYRIHEYHISDEDYYDTDTAGKPGEYHMTVFMEADPEKGVFALAPNEWGDGLEYAGTVHVNGVSTSFYYESDLDLVCVFIDFTIDESTGEARYYAASGDSRTYTKRSGEDVVIVFRNTQYDSVTFDLFRRIEADGQPVDPDAYTAERGSAVITVSSEYLDTLPAGAHTFTAVFKDGSADAVITVAAADGADRPIPNTGVAGLYALIPAASLLALGSMALIAVFRRRCGD